jgi:nucleoside phosphorylase
MEDKKEIFIVFDKDDVDFLKELKNHLKPMETQGLITVWDTTQIVGGTEWKQEINKHMKTASIVLLLVSAGFMASREIYNLARQAVAKNAPPEVFVIPILLREVDWEYSDLGKLAPLPSNGRPVSSWANRNAAYLDIVKGIREIVAEHNAQSDQMSSHVEKIAEIRSPETEKTIIASDHLDYRLEDQSWYAPTFPRTIAIDQEQVSALSSEIDIVIITANNEELKAVMHKLEPYPRKRSILLAYIGPETYYLGKFGEFKTVVTKCRMGSAIDSGSATLATNQAQEIWHPRAIIMVGVAFGKDASKQKIGDVLVASQIIPYEGQRVGEKVNFRSPIPPSNPVLLNRFENALTWSFVRPDEKFCVLRIGPILSGEKLVDNPDFKAWLFDQFPLAIGGEMEGAGLCAASGRVGVAWILVKSICDWGDGTKQDLYQPLAAAAATSLVHHVLSQRTILNSIKKY